MRILWSSNGPWVSTGYGVQTRLFCPRIRDLGHEVAICAWYGLQGGVIGWDGMTVYPGAFHPYGADIAPQHAKEFGADLVISLIDAHAQPHAMLNKHGRWAPWFPVDSEPLPRPVMDEVKHAWQPLVFSRHGERMAREAGLDPRYVPHGVDTKVYRPLPQAEARERLGLPADAFIAVAVMANKGLPSRKAWPEQIEAFARFRQRHPDAMLYLHTVLGTEMQGVDITRCLRDFEVPEDAVRVGSQYRALLGFPDEVMRVIYSAGDVLLNCSMGEGFGVPIIEAQACGTPVITGDWTAMSEITGAGWAVKQGTPWYVPPQSAYQYLPHVDGIVEALEQAREARGDDALRRRAVEFAAGYDADLVAREFWRPVLAELEERIRDEGAEHAPEVEVAAA